MYKTYKHIYSSLQPVELVLCFFLSPSPPCQTNSFTHTDSSWVFQFFQAWLSRQYIQIDPA